MDAIVGQVEAVRVDEAARIEVGEGCWRRDLPSVAGVRAWIVEMAPGSQWPRVDEHPDGEDVYVLEGEMIEGDRRFPAGTYLHFAPGSSHRPRTETGLRLIGWNPQDPAVRAADPKAANGSPHRVLFDFEIDFSNGGGMSGHDFRLDIDGEDIADAALADYLVRDMRLLMVGSVRIRNKRIIAETHKRV